MDGIEHLLTSKRPAGVPSQEVEQLEFRGREFHRPAADTDFAVAQVDHHVPNLYDLTLLFPFQDDPSVLGTAQHGLHSGKQHFVAAQVKSSLHAALFGPGADPKYTFDALFSAQVEPHNRDWAMEEGKYVFDCYVHSGFYDDLLALLKQSKEPPCFEFTVEAEINGVPFLGKPDARWVTPVGIPVVHDFKVHGYCSKYTTSPCRSYMRCRDGYLAVKPSRSHNAEHREFLAYQHGDLTINTTYLEAANTAWADQLSLYGWAMGDKIGDENVVLSIHQIVAKPTDGRSNLRVASYRARVQASYQHQLADRLRRCWNAIADGHIFPDLSREDSDARCEVLDETAVGLQSDGSSREEYFNEATRDRYRG